MVPIERRSIGDRLEGASGGFFLIGLGVLWLTGLSFWPWILAVFAVDSAFKALIKQGLRGVISSVFWLVGFLVLFTTGTFWPGILILVGLSIVLNAVMPASSEFRPKEKRKRKAKRTPAARRRPVVYDDEDEWDELDYILADDLAHDSDPDR